MTLAINSTVFGHTSPVDIPPPLNNACLSLVGSTCPVGAGQALTHGTTLPVNPDLHDGIPVTLYAQIYNDFNLTVFCSIIHVIVMWLINLRQTIPVVTSDISGAFLYILFTFGNEFG